MIGFLIKDTSRVTATRTAQVLMCNYQRLTACVKNDGAPQNVDGTFDLPVIVKWWRLAGGATRKETDVATRHKRAAMEAKEASAAMANIALAKEESTLIDRDEAAANMEDVILRARGALASLPSRMVQVLSLADPVTAEREWKQEIEHVLTDMSKVEEEGE